MTLAQLRILQLAELPPAAEDGGDLAGYADLLELGRLGM